MNKSSGATIELGACSSCCERHLHETLLLLRDFDRAVLHQPSGGTVFVGGVTAASIDVAAGSWTGLVNAPVLTIRRIVRERDARTT